MVPDLPAVLLVATMDTKEVEAGYLRSCLERAGVSVVVLDAGIRGESPRHVDVRSDQVAVAGGRSIEEVRSLAHEGEALRIMTQGAVKESLALHRQGKVQGIIGLGGSMGTTLGTAVMRALPVGVPKVMISTMASRDTRPFVGTKDVLMLHSVCDLSGLNRITRRVLCNGARAAAGMVHGGPVEAPSGPLVLVSTLGTTEPCAVQVREALEREGYEVVTFHTVGAGGEALESMIREEEAAGVAELSLHEIADHLFDGNYDAGPQRGTAAFRKGTPSVWVPGNVDFLVAGPLEAARRNFPERRYHVHNEAITVVRTNEDEMARIGETVAVRCEEAKGHYEVLVPMMGFSAFDREGGPLFDPRGPEAFVQAFCRAIGDDRHIRRVPYHINQPEFSRAVVESLSRVMKF
jgi:uncharacterized protein (UPF0261 family)